MKLVVIDLEGNEISKKTLNVPVISEKNINEHLIHDVHLYHRHRKHTGNHSVKGRSAVSGGGAKPYRQKGGGRARRGTNRSPLRRGGGVIFGPQVRDYGIKLNKKVLNEFYKSYFSLRDSSDYLILSYEEDKIGKTKDVVNLMKGQKCSAEKITIIADREESVLIRLTGNIPFYTVLFPDELDVSSITNSYKILFTEKALTRFEEYIKW